MQTFLSTPARREYFPTLGLATARVEFADLLRPGVGVRFDFGFGASGKTSLVLSDPYVGELRYAISVSELTGGAALAAAIEPWPWLRLGGEVRLGAVYLSRRFAGDVLPPQSFSTLTPGVGGEAAVRIAGWLTAGIAVRAHYVYFNVDQPQSLAYLDGGLFITAVLR